MARIKLNVRQQAQDETAATLLGTDGLFTYPLAGRADVDNVAADALARQHPPQVAFVRDVARFNYRGLWAAGSYRQGELVVHNGNVFLATADTTAEPPLAEWQEVGGLPPSIRVNSAGDIGIWGDADTTTSLTVHTNSSHTYALDLDGSAVTGSDVAIRFLLGAGGTNTFDAGIKATATGWLEFEADSGFEFRINDVEQWQMQSNGHLIPVGARNIGEGANAVNDIYTSSIRASDRILVENIAALSDSLNFRTHGANRWTIGADALSPGADSSYDIGAADTRVRVGYFDTINALTYGGLGEWVWDEAQETDLSTLPSVSTAQATRTVFSGMAHDPADEGSYVIVSETDRRHWYWNAGNAVWTTVDYGTLTAPSGSTWTSNIPVRNVYPVGQPAITRDGCLVQPVYIGQRQTVQGAHIYSGGAYALYLRRLRSRGSVEASDGFPATVDQGNFTRPFPTVNSSNYWFGAFQAIRGDELNIGGIGDTEVVFFLWTDHFEATNNAAHSDAGYYGLEFFTAPLNNPNSWNGSPASAPWSDDIHVLDGVPAYADRQQYTGVHDDGRFSWWVHASTGYVQCRDSLRVSRTNSDGHLVVSERHEHYDMAPAVIPDHVSGRFVGIYKPQPASMLLLDHTTQSLHRTDWYFGLMTGVIPYQPIQTSGGSGQAAIPTFLTLDETNNRVGINVSSPQTTLDVLSPAWTVAQFERQGGDGSARIKVGDHTYLEGAVNGAAELRFGGIGGAQVSNETLQFKRGSDLLLTLSHTGTLIPDDNAGQDLGDSTHRWREGWFSSLRAGELRGIATNGNINLGRSGDTGRLRVNLAVEGTVAPVGPGSTLGASGSYWDSIWARQGTFTSPAGVVGAGLVRAAIVIPHFSSELGRTGNFPTPTEGQLVTVGNNLTHYSDGAWRTIGSTTFTGEPPWGAFPNSIVPDVTDSRSLGSDTKAWHGLYTQSLRNVPNEFVDITAARFQGVLDASAVTEARGLATRLELHQSQADGLLRLRIRDDTSATVLGNEVIFTDNQLSVACAEAFGGRSTNNNGKVATYSNIHGRVIWADPPGSAAASLSFLSDADGNIELHQGGVYASQISPGMVEIALAHTFADGERAANRVVRVHPTSDGHMESVPIEQVIAEATGPLLPPHAVRMRSNGTAAAPVLSLDSDRDTGVYWPETNQIAIAASGEDVMRFIAGGSALPTGAHSAVLPPVRTSQSNWTANPAFLGAPTLEGRWNEIHGGTVGYQELVQDSHLVNKYNVEPSSFATVDAALKALKVRKFEWKTAQGQKRYGIILEETSESATDTLLQGQDGLNVSDLVAMLVRGYQSVSRREEELRVKLDALAAVMDALPASGGSVREAVRGAGAAGRIQSFAAEPDETVPANRQGTPP